MEAKDLMIGDLVHYIGDAYNNDVNIRVREIHEDFVYSTLAADEFYYDELEPIPLTPEILEKNGFVGELCSNGIDYVSEEYKLRIIYKTNDEGWTIYANHFGLDKKDVFVHELQHALRLCGIEKEIEL